MSRYTLNHRISFYLQLYKNHNLESGLMKNTLFILDFSYLNSDNHFKY